MESDLKTMPRILRILFFHAVAPCSGWLLLSGCVLPGLATSLDSDSLLTMLLELGKTRPTAPAYTVTNSNSGTLFTSEGGALQTFTLSLSSQPTSAVSIPVSISNAGEGEVSLDGVTYGASTVAILDASNYSVGIPIYVRGVDDAVVDGNVAYTVNLGTTTSSDPNYDGLNPADLAALNFDNDSVSGSLGIAVAPSAGLVTSETGGQAFFGVVLQSAPAANVTIPLSSSNPGEGTPAPASLTFTPLNWSTPQTVTVTGVNDGLPDGNIGYSIVTGPATSADSTYNGLDPADVSVTNVGITAGVVVTPINGLSVSESGTVASFVVFLTSGPSASVSISLASSNTTEATVSPASLTFTSLNWATPQIVTITGVDDAVADGNQTVTISTGMTASLDPDYNGTVNPADVTVTSVDDDGTGISVVAAPSLITGESGMSQSFSVVLNSRPSGTNSVTLPVSVSNATEATISAPFAGSSGTLTFTTANWNVPQTVTVQGMDDAIVDGSVGYTVVLGASASGDALYNGINPADIPATNLDNDGTPGITVTPQNLSMGEGGASQTIYVVLNAPPSASVSIPVSSSNVGEGTVSPASLLFTTGNWSTPQAVTVQPVNDAVIDGTIAYSIVLGAATSADANYNGLNPPDVSVTNADNDRKIFRTTLAMSGGNLGGIAGADAYCMNAAYGYPGTGTYKAMIVDGVNRQAYPGQIDWVFKPGATYFRSDGITPVGTTNGLATFDLVYTLLTNTFVSGATTQYWWTGLFNDWSTDAKTCSGWTSSIGGVKGQQGDNDPNYWAIWLNSSGFGCNDATTYLICVQQ